MTPEEKIAALVEHIKVEFPDGCKGIYCVDCPLHHAKYGTTDYDTCEMLFRTASGQSH